MDNRIMWVLVLLAIVTAGLWSYNPVDPTPAFANDSKYHRCLNKEMKRLEKTVMPTQFYIDMGKLIDTKCTNTLTYEQKIGMDLAIKYATKGNY